MTTTAIPTADLEPSLIAGRTYATRRRVTYVDAAVLLSLMVALIALVPSRLILPGTTDLGRPGLLVGFILFCWWILVRFTSHLVMVGPQPIRWAVCALMVTILISYAVGFLRGLTTMEANSADRTMLFFCVFCGVILTAADGVPNWLRLRRLLRVLVWCASAVSVIALIQYVFAIDVTRYMIFPGLQEKGMVIGFEERGAGIRVASTTTHYIELAAFLSLTLPFAVHFAIFGGDRRQRRFSTLAAMIIAGGIAVTISRTGIVAVAIAALVLVPLWSWRLRYNIAVFGVGMVAALAAMKPSLVQTLLHLFDNPTGNSSIAARTGRYPLVFHYVAERPWLGRGTGTWVPPQYQILDNEWLAYLISNGIIGVATLAGLHITGIALAGLALRRSSSAEDRHLCAALIATQIIGIAVAGTFDSLSFSTYATTLAVTVGLCGTVWRLTHPARTVRTSSTRWFLDGQAGAGARPATPRRELPRGAGQIARG